MTTGIVILNYNNYQDTINCIKSVYEYCSEEELLLVVVDNGSQNDSVHQLSAFFTSQHFSYKVLDSRDATQHADAKVILFLTGNNIGYARGNNVGIHFLIQQQVDHILILNNDILLTSNILPPMIDCLNVNPDIGIISPLLTKDGKNIDYSCCRTIPSDKMLVYESMKFLNLSFLNNYIDQKFILKVKPKLLQQDIVFCDIVSGSCILAKTTTWDQLNGFDPNTFLYYEENILFEKLKNLRLQMAIVPGISAIHLGAKSTKKVANTKILCIELDSLRYYLKNYRNVGPFKILAINTMRLFQIRLLGLYNHLKYFKPKVK